MKQRVFAVACSLALAWSTPALAQLAPANDLGVALGHMHLAVKDVETKFEAPSRVVPNTRTKIAFLTDPWGTYIEVTEKLAPEAQSSVTR